MAGLLARVDAAYRGEESRYSADTWLTEYLLPSVWGGMSPGRQWYPFGGLGQQTLAGNRAAEIANDLPGYAQALRACPPAFAAQLVRSLVLSQARFVFRNPPWHWTNPRRQFSNSDLRLLEQPWPRGTTGDLVSRMEWHAGLAGNAFVLSRDRRLRLLRPDWTAICFGSQLDPEENPAGAIDAEVIAYVYANQGIGVGDPVVLYPDSVAHWCPLPDPEMTGLGMSWLTPAIRELQADRLTTTHKIRFFEHGATANLVIKGIPAMTPEQFDALVDQMERQHAGVANAYRTLYLTAGADATVVGSNLKDLDLGNVQDSGETRLSMLSRVPAALLGIKAGLQGSTLNAGNFGMARRLFADLWIYPALQDLASSLASVVNVPADAELWYDATDMPILREDARDAAEIEQVKGDTINKYVREGFTPESAIAAVRGQDISLLRHTGYLSVQLQPPGQAPAGTLAPAAPGPPGAPTPPATVPAANGAGGGGPRTPPARP